MSARTAEEYTVQITLDVEPDQVLWSLEDELGTILVSERGVANASIDGAVVTLTIEAIYNTLPAHRYRGLRLIRLRYRAEDAFVGWRDLDQTYEVERPEGNLVVQTNTFVTYNEALLLALEMSDKDGFDAASRAARTTALAEAWRALVRLRYDIPIEYDRVMSRVTDFPGADPGDLTELDAQAFLSLDARFVAAIKRAQVVDAIERLSSRKVEDARRAGLMSSSIGEVSQMYRPGRPFDIGVSRRALMELRGYVTFSPRMTRV